ncbi:MAG: hypothetical protein EPO24_08770 [Bacteroidetes bacterium]|nr:MAG: hypothetical protein EPO24_08770 [Bacteroidota bacterium]
MKYKSLNNLTAAAFVFTIALLLQSCNDHGLAPEPAPPYGISGTVFFSNWLPQDSIKDLRVVVFKSYPPQNIVVDVLQGKAKYTETLTPYGVASISYTLMLSPLSPGRYEYLVVAQQYGDNVFNDWRVVGQYSLPADSGNPSVILVPGNKILQNINMTVDFNNLPPQPITGAGK